MKDNKALMDEAEITKPKSAPAARTNADRIRRLSAKELAEACGKTENAVASAMSHAMRKGQRCRYVAVRL